MIQKLGTYSSYKPSNVPWLGKIPEHWIIRRGKRIFKYKKELNKDYKRSNILSLTLRGVVNNDPENPQGLVPKDYSTYQFFNKNDLVFKLIDLENLQTSRVGLVHEDGIMSPAYIRLSSNHNSIQRFFYYFYYSLYQRGIYNQLGEGVRSTLNQTDLLNISVPIPPIDEQRAIVKYLDYIDRRIKKYIRAKQKLIKLLEEQKQAIIHQAVTRGLDPNVALKPSGVEWLGDIPAHWVQTKLRNLITPMSERNCPELPLLSVVREKGVIIRDVNNREENFNFVPDDLSNYKVVKQGQFVINKMKAWQGSCGISNFDGIVSPAYYVFQVKGIEGKYLSIALRSKAYVPFFQQASDGIRIGQWDLSNEKLKSISFILPPMKEQLRIVKYLDNISIKYKLIIQNQSEKILYIKEYRNRLIADVVTGKVDVREAARQLPDEMEALFEDNEELIEDENESVEEMEEAAMEEE